VYWTNENPLITLVLTKNDNMVKKPNQEGLLKAQLIRGEEEST
jgi:hypothetical protein